MTGEARCYRPRRACLQRTTRSRGDLRSTGESSIPAATSFAACGCGRSRNGRKDRNEDEYFPELRTDADTAVTHERRLPCFSAPGGKLFFPGEGNFQMRCALCAQNHGKRIAAIGKKYRY